MYDELMKELRRHHCDAKEDDTQEVCEECAYDVIIADKSVPSGHASVCVCGLMNRAADAIEKLSKAHWIPVTERLPEDDNTICILTNGVSDAIGYRGKVFGWHLIWTDYVAESDVTHWMPLPEPPKEE